MSNGPAPVDGGSSKTEAEQPKTNRTNRACDACRRKKVRCGGVDENSESCAECLASGAACTFQDKSVKRGPPRGYVQALEARLAAMESLLAQLTANNDLDSLSEHNNSSVAADSPIVSCVADEGHICSRIAAAADPANRAKLAQASDEQSAILNKVDQLADQLADLDVGKVRYVGRASGIHIAQTIHDISDGNPEMRIGPDDKQSCGAEPVSLVESILTARFKEKQAACKLPTQELGKKLVDAYFDNINAYYPMLHRPYFERCLAGGFLDSDDSFKGLYFAVCALGARFVDDDTLLPEDPTGMYLEGPQQSKGYSLFISATDMASPKLIPATLFDIQSAALGVMWLTASASPTTAWSAAGHAVRRLIDIGIHRERSSRWYKSPMADQLRKRAFVALYDFDRNLSSTLGRPVALHDSEFDVVEPIDISDSDLDGWETRGGPAPLITTLGPGALSGFLCMHQLRRITERVLQTLYSTAAPSVQKTNEIVCELDSLLNDWLSAVPAHLRWEPSKMSTADLVQSGIIHSSYYVTQIFVHREFLNPEKGKFHSFPSLAICSNASRSIANVLDSLRQKNVLELGCHTHAVSAVSAAMILLINVFSNSTTGTTLTSSAMADVNKVLQVLKTLSKQNYMAMRCSMGLEQFIESGRINQRFAALSRSTDGTAHKRAAEEDSPASSSLHSPDSTADSPNSSLLSTSQSGTKKSRGTGDFVDLPMTTEQLGQSTFAGRPTLALPKGAKAPTAQVQPDATANWLNSFLASPPASVPPNPIDSSLWAGTALGVAPTAAMLAGLTPAALNRTDSSAPSTAPSLSPGASDPNAVSWDMFSQFNFSNLASPGPIDGQQQPLGSSFFSGVPDFGFNFGSGDNQENRQALGVPGAGMMDFGANAQPWNANANNFDWNLGADFFQTAQ